MVNAYRDEMKKRDIKNFRYGTIYDSPNGINFCTRFAFSEENIKGFVNSVGFEIVEVHKEELETEKGDENIYYILEKVREEDFRPITTAIKHEIEINDISVETLPEDRKELLEIIRKATKDMREMEQKLLDRAEKLLGLISQDEIKELNTIRRDLSLEKESAQRISLLKRMARLHPDVLRKDHLVQQLRRKAESMKIKREEYALSLENYYIWYGKKFLQNIKFSAKLRGKFEKAKDWLFEGNYNLW